MRWKIHFKFGPFIKNALEEEDHFMPCRSWGGISGWEKMQFLLNTLQPSPPPPPDYLTWSQVAKRRPHLSSPARDHDILILELI